MKRPDLGWNCLSRHDQDILAFEYDRPTCRPVRSADAGLGGTRIVLATVSKWEGVVNESAL